MISHRLIQEQMIQQEERKNPATTLGAPFCEWRRIY
jgi:hypothetical protein